MTMPQPRRRSLLRAAASFFVLGLGGRLARAGESVWTTYQTPEAFIQEAFGGAPPPVKAMDYEGKKLRYWKANGRSAWILDDLGKPGYQLTTAGFVVKGGAIEIAKVLVYRESRGEQVADASFLKQLLGAKLAGATIDKHVDNISGATLSVQMMQRMAATALKLDAIAA